MKEDITISVGVENLVYDNINAIKEAIDNNKPFELKAYIQKDVDYDQSVCVFLDNEDCTVIWNLPFYKAYYFAKSLLALMEASNKKWIKIEEV